MKKTTYSLMIGFNTNTYKETYRRVWQAEDGQYYIKKNGEYINVTNRREYFVED